MERVNTTAQDWPPVATEPVIPAPNTPQPGTKLDMHYNRCFGCGQDVDSGLHMQATMGENATVISEFLVDKAHQGAPGLAHGGLLSCAFDEAIGTAVGHLLRQPAVTGKLDTDFRTPVPVGSTLFIAAQVDGVARRKIYASAQGHLDSEDGPVAAQARALFVTVAAEHFSDHADPEMMDMLRHTPQAEGL